MKSCLKWTIMTILIGAASVRPEESPGFDQDAAAGEQLLVGAAAAEEPVAGFTVPASAYMFGTGRGEAIPPVEQQPSAFLHKLSPRKGIFTVLLPPGAANLTLNLAQHEFVFGTAFQPETADDDCWYLNITKSWFWGLTPENRFKWFNYEKTPGVVEPAKELLDSKYIQFAKDNGFAQARGHTLDWYIAKNFWPYQLSCDEYVAALKQRIVRDVTAFRGKFTHYDVFNELIAYPGMLDRCQLWNTTFPDAFKWAAEADPDAKLCLNDFSLIEADAGPKLLRLINDYLLPNNAPIHCIGIQAHFEEFGINITRQQEGLDLLAATGLDLYITEFTLFSTWRGPSGKPESFLDEDTQARQTVNLFKLWFEHPAVKGIYMWGFWDRTIWIKNSGVFRSDKTPKKAALAIQELWQQEWHTQLTVDKPASATEFYGYFGVYHYSFVTPADGQLHSGTIKFSRGQLLQDLRVDAASQAQ